MAIFNSYVSLPEGTWSPANWSKIPCSVPIHRDPKISWAQGNSLHWCHRWSPANVGSSHQSSDVHNRNSQVEIVSKWEIARGLPLEQKKSLAGPLSSFFFVLQLSHHPRPCAILWPPLATGRLLQGPFGIPFDFGSEYPWQDSFAFLKPFFSTFHFLLFSPHLQIIQPLSFTHLMLKRQLNWPNFASVARWTKWAFKWETKLGYFPCRGTLLQTNLDVGNSFTDVFFLLDHRFSRFSTSFSWENHRFSTFFSMLPPGFTG